VNKNVLTFLRRRVHPPRGGGGADIVAPEITSSDTVSNVENVALAHALTANEAVTWTITGGADELQFDLTGSTLTWVANGTQDFETPADANTNNAYIVQVTATDAALNATNQTITVTVTDADEVAPTITSADTANNVENTVLAHALTANEAVTWTLTGGADQARFEVSGSTLRWASNGTKNYEAPDDAGTNNTYVAQVTATDALLNATNQTVTVTVTDADEVAPTITSASSGNCAENATLSFALEADEAVTWTITGGADADVFEINVNELRWTGNGVLDYETPEDADANNTYVVQVTATDALNNSSNQTITITVTDVVEGGSTAGESMGLLLGITKAA
jgi:ribosomal protein S11